MIAKDPVAVHAGSFVIMEHPLIETLIPTSETRG
jgi:hypothetical protein